MADTGLERALKPTQTLSEGASSTPPWPISRSIVTLPPLGTPIQTDAGTLARDLRGLAVEIRVAEDWAELEKHRVRWNELAGAPGAGSVFQTLEWNRSWWSCFGAGSKLQVYLAFRGQRLDGIAPLLIEPTGALRFIGSPNSASDYCDLIATAGDDEVIRALVRAFLAAPRSWKRVDLSNVPTQSPHRGVLEGQLKASCPYVASEVQCGALTRLLGDPTADRELLNKKSLKRHFRHFFDQGGLEFRHLEDEKEIMERLKPFFVQHVERRALAGDRSLFEDPRQEEFYREIVRSHLPLGWLRFSEVIFQGKALAYHFGFEYGGRYIWYKPTFNVEFLKKSPGEVLLKFLLEHAIGRKLQEFDFTVGEESFKYRFANLVRTNHRIRVFSGVLGFLSFHLRRAARPAVSWLRRKTSRPVQ